MTNYKQQDGFSFKITDALFAILTWQDGICVQQDGILYIRKLEGEQWAVGNEDEPADKEELFDYVGPAIVRFLQKLREYDTESIERKEGYEE